MSYSPPATVLVDGEERETEEMAGRRREKERERDASVNGEEIARRRRKKR